MPAEVYLSEGTLRRDDGVTIPVSALRDDGTYASAAGSTACVPSAATQAGTAGAPTPTTVWQFNAASGDTHGPFSLVIGGALFQSTFDRVMYWGYNAADQGGKLVSTEPKFSWQIESDYDDGTRRNIEVYNEFAPASAVTVTDGVTTSGSPTVTFASTTLTSTAHKGQGISGSGIPASSYIGVVNSAHSIGLSSSPTANTPVNATATASGVSLTITPGGTTGMRAVFWQINRATGKMTDFELRNSGITFTDWDTNATWGVLNSQGLTITPAAGQSVTFNLGWVTGGVNVLQISNNTKSLQISPSTAGSTAWNFGIGSDTICMQLAPNNLDMSQNSGNGAISAGNGGGFQIQNNAKNALWAALRNSADELVVGKNSQYTGISFQAGGNNIFRLGPTGIGFYGTAPGAKPTITGAKLPSDTVLANLLSALATLGLLTDSTT